MSDRTRTLTLHDRVILITGAAGCLGRIAAKSCASQGATVILLDKTIAGLERVYDDLVASGAPEPAIYPFDLTGANERQYQELATVIEQKFGVLRGLLHNAAVLGALCPMAHSNTVDWNNTINANLSAPYLLTRVVLPLMEKAADASIVFTSDSAARMGRAYWGAYGVSKIAIEGMARILADEMESKGTVRVNTLIPGVIDSPIRKRAYPGENSTQRRMPESLAALYVFLFGPASLSHTGELFEAEQFSG